MNFKHLLPSDYSVFLWSGGKTTELFIFPENATLAERNFDVRISTASIEVELSSFTPMNGYLRKLLVLDGVLELHHELHHSTVLSKFEQDAFSGDWLTKSKGVATDFNVIYRPHFCPEIAVKELNPLQIQQFSNAFVYVLEGGLNINGSMVSSKSSLFCEGDFEIEAVEFARIVIIIFNNVGFRN